MSRRRKTQQRNRASVGLDAAAELLDARLVDPLDHDASDHSARYGGIAKLPQHHGLDARSSRIEDGVLDVIAREDRPNLFAVAAPRRIVQNDALAAAGQGRSGSAKQQEPHGDSHEATMGN
jgi:hypothetical protein